MRHAHLDAQNQSAWKAKAVIAHSWRKLKSHVIVTVKSNWNEQCLALFSISGSNLLYNHATADGLKSSNMTRAGKQPVGAVCFYWKAPQYYTL